MISLINHNPRIGRPRRRLSAKRLRTTSSKSFKFWRTPTASTLASTRRYESLFDSHRSLQLYESLHSLTDLHLTQVHHKGAERYAMLMRASPSFAQHSRCALLTQKGYDTSLKNAEKYLREGVVCFAEALGLTSAVDPWRFCLTRNYGDYDSCITDFQSTR